MTWLRPLKPRPRATTRLICFAHAGGSVTAYRDWPALLPGTVEPYGVQLPGRADRFGDPIPANIHEIVASVVEEIQPLLDRDIVLFGHSMGAVIAYETTRALEARGDGPVRLFVSGSAAPHEPRRRKAISSYDDEAFLAELTELGGTELEILSHQAIREIVFPYIRADFRLLEEYRHVPGPALRTPISVIVGDTDPVVTPLQAKEWQARTESGFSLTILPGGHFYLQPQRAAVVAEILRRLS
ncbi:thioesterase II family protein [Streptosporangium algeriense]|uniref:Thioesterase II family protein n=1 Tax=Streptosporangium algeriense TaxID=1682748 RepID=A0ABW3DW77_9ACTN